MGDSRPSIFLHDFGGYPFITALSRELAARGHRVHHAYNGRLTAGQDTVVLPNDPDGLTFVPIRSRRHFDKYSLARRVPLEVEYGGLVAAAIVDAAPDLVVSANAPVVSQARIARGAERAGARFAFWLQDLLAVGIQGELEKRLGGVGSLAGAGLVALERRLLRRSDRVVAISPRFLDHLRTAGVADDRVTVLPNWAPLERTPSVAPENAWADEHGVTRPAALYAGTLGRKHDPELLVEVAREIAGRGEVLVASEGPSAEELAARSAGSEVALRVLPFQPYERVPQMLGSADVLLAMITEEASTFSVPSKVLTYLCAGRPVVAAMPEDNPAAVLLRDLDAGIVTPVGDRAAFVHAVVSLLDDPGRAAAMGRRGREYAESAFRIDLVADRFLQAVDH